MAELQTQAELFAACRVLFGPDIQLTEDFLAYLQPSGAKSAYRRRAKEVHPDLVNGEDESLRQERSRLFREVAAAFEVLSGYLSDREQLPRADAPFTRCARPTPRPPAPTPAGAPRNRYLGPLPERPLEIGLYLYYRGAVTFPQLIDALLWQRRQRPAMGHIARRWGWLSDADLRRILTGSEAPGRFGDRARQLGLLSPFQINTLLFFQRCQQRRLGEYFIERGLLSAAAVETFVRELGEHNRRLTRPAPAGARPASGRSG